MNGEDIARIIEAADTFQAIVILLLIGFFLLAWKYGREILQLARALHEKTEKIDKGLETNHGSENMGKAIDRQYEMLLDLQVTREIDARRSEERHTQLDRQLRDVQASFLEYKSNMRPLVEFGLERMDAVLNERLEDEPESGENNARP